MDTRGRDLVIMGKSWKILRTASGQLSCENGNKSEHDIAVIQYELSVKFKNRISNEHIIVMYDCWSGVYIMQNVGFKYTDSTQQLLREICEYLNELEES